MVASIANIGPTGVEQTRGETQKQVEQSETWT